jgi:hypothetical protein
MSECKFIQNQIVKINISTIENENAISEVKAITADNIVGGGGVTINWNIQLQDGGPGAANAGIPKFDFQAITTDIDAENNGGVPYHQAGLIFSGSMGD